MSTSTHTPHGTRPAVVPRPRAAVEPPIQRPPAPPPQQGERLGLYERHAWLIPAVAIASVIAVFVAMVLLTWAAGGGTPFDR